MAKCIERVGKDQYLCYECPVCHKTYQSKDSCRSHTYRKHREWAFNDSENNLKTLENELSRKNK